MVKIGIMNGTKRRFFVTENKTNRGAGDCNPIGEKGYEKALSGDH
jgi:hypothetical protein